QIHGRVAAFRGFDGANGLRPTRVWLGRSFDKATARRSAPAGHMILVADELANVFHLPIDIAGFGSAPTHLSPARRPSGDGNVICLLEDGRQTPARISPADARHHIHVLGPTGVGKSTLLLNLATDDILRAAVLTLLLRPGSSLCEVPLLLLQPEARKVFTSDLRDPIGLGPFWNEYEQMADGQRLQMVGPVLNKLRSVLLRRTVRNIMGQPRSTIDLASCMDHGGILLVSLAKGLLGEETSRLLRAFLVARIWQTAMARA